MRIYSFPLLLLFCAALCVLHDRAIAQDPENEPGAMVDTENLLASDDILEMSIEELLTLPVEVTGSLTEAPRRLNPSTVTTLTREDIWQSGARDIDELLDIYLPNFQRMNEYYEFRKNGLRGINSDRDDKYLILVNGRVVNEHTHYGAISERDFPTLRDIHHIDVVRGPGSALYGPGAIAMVINIVTDNAMTFQGTEVTTRVGGYEAFYSGEIKHGQKLTDESGYFLYAGVTYYRGGQLKNTPIESGRPDMIPLEDQPHYHEGWRGQPKFKAHAQYTHGNFDAWIRYTKGGEYRAKLPFFDPEWRDQGDGYQQLLMTTSYTYEFDSTFSLEGLFSFDVFDYEKAVFYRVLSHREDEYLTRLLARWEPDEDHSLAFGGEYSYEKFGKKSPGWP
ncbi:MAG: TonB-dependent receptor plug domain-containing protein, partial [Planctomycetota bacterium]